MHLKHSALLATLLFAAATGFAQREVTDDFYVHFPVSSNDLIINFDDNNEEIREIFNFFKMVDSSDTIKLQEVTFFGSASPEGNYQYNHKLAITRRDSLEHFVTRKVNIPANIIKLGDKYIDWDLLKKELQKSNEPWAPQAIDIINQPAKLVPYRGALTIDARVPQLQKLDGGNAWNVLLEKFFPALRMAGVEVRAIYEPKPAPEPVVEEVVEEVEVVTPEPEPVVVEEVIETPEETVEEVVAIIPVIDECYRKFTISSNAVAWVLAVGNLGLEIDICKHLSFAVPVYYSTMNYFTRKIKFRTFATQPELRYWFNPCNEGWYINGHFGVGSYNVAWNGKTRYQDHNDDTPAIGGGIGFGYRLNLSKNGLWKVEFGAGVGVYKAHYDMFVNEYNGPYYGTRKKTWVGLDQLKATFSYTIPIRKGGAL